MKFIQKFPLYISILLVSTFSCNKDEESSSGLHGSVSFRRIGLEFAPMGSPGSRVMGVSPWKHIFPDAANLVFTNKATAQDYILLFNPNDFSTPYSINIPFGAYDYLVSVEGDVFSDFLPFAANGEFILDSPSLGISLKAETDYGLVTVKDQYMDKAVISEGSNESGLVLPVGGTHWYKYVRGGTAATLKIKESLQGSTFNRELHVFENNHYNFVLKLNDGSAVINVLEMDPFELEEEEIPIGFSSKFFEENGTIKCPGTIPGEKGMVNGKVYEVVDRAFLIQRRDEDADLSCVCTSLVTDMSRMFEGKWEFNKDISSWDVGNVTDMTKMFAFNDGFNQTIGIWDVSKVTNMSHMFLNATFFNQPIGNWDVLNVTDMSFMFSRAESFNQPIGNWKVGNVTNMFRMFEDAFYFNQFIGDWDVSKVTNMSMMFLEAHAFNQSIGDWDVGNVVDMSRMFRKAYSFNQPIGKWNVGKVENMNWMFSDFIIFNQPIGDWDVSNVKDMSGMFDDALAFNQDLSKWCVINIPSNPGFSGESPLTEENMPVWGTCPD